MAKKNILIKVAEKLVHEGLVENDMVETFSINAETYEIVSDRVDFLHYGDYAKTLKEAFAILNEKESKTPTFKWIRTYEEACSVIEKLQDEGIF